MICYSILIGASAFALLAAQSTECRGAEIEQRYATRWNVAPIARFAMDAELYANAARCRIDEGEYKDRWINGRATGIILGKTTWRLPVDGMPPGEYQVTYDLRTPTGAEWIPGRLRVPQIVRHTGRVGRNLSMPEEWPQDIHKRIECDSGQVEFSWDRDNLYIRRSKEQSVPVQIEIDLLPAAAGKHVKTISVNEAVVISWRELFPSVPMVGQVLRYRVVKPSNTEWLDLLFVGNGVDQYFGATTVSTGPGSDDQGPPRPILDALVDMSGLDCRSSGVHWGRVQRHDPGDGKPQYDWSGVLADANLYRGGLTYCHIELGNDWAEEIKETDPERYWKLAEDFACEAARVYASVGVKYFSLGYNEPECFFRTDKEDFFVEHLTHLANAVKRAVPDAQIIAGKFSSGDPGLIRQFYRHGFRDNFDVMDIHPYNNDPVTGCAMGEVVASHQTLEELGMGHKRLFLGEGWGPTRDLKQVVRTKWDEPVSEAEADVTRQYYQNGYRCLVSARSDYSPDWVLGAKYFTLNDNVGGTYWKQAAKPVYSSTGELLYHLIGELRFGDPDTLKAFFCNGGLVDFFGKPKGQWFFDFPPALPEVRILATGGPEYVLEGQWHTLNVSVVNANPRPITNLNLGLRDRTGKFKGSISAEALGESKCAQLAPGEQWNSSVRVRLDKGDPGHLRLALELQYFYDGEKHISDDIVATQIRPALDVRMDPPRVVLEPGRTSEVKVSVLNNNREPVQCPFVDIPGDCVDLRLPEAVSDIAPGEDVVYTLQARAASTEPGVARVQLAAHTRSTLTAVVPLNCPKLSGPVRVDGNLSDWPQGVLSEGSIRFGESIGVGQRPADDPFPEPPPAKTSALEQVDATSNEKAPDAPVFGANAAVAWDDEAFYLAVMVEDETFKQDYSGMETWREDSIQIAFDPANDGYRQIEPDGSMPDAYGTDDYEMSLALTPDGPQVVVLRGPKGTRFGVRDDAALAVNRSDGFTIYEARLPWSMLEGVSPKPGAIFGFDVLVNNFERGDRYTLGWAGGIADGKFPGLFAPVVLR